MNKRRDSRTRLLESVATVPAHLSGRSDGAMLIQSEMMFIDP